MTASISAAESVPRPLAGCVAQNDAGTSENADASSPHCSADTTGRVSIEDDGTVVRTGPKFIER